MANETLSGTTGTAASSLGTSGGTSTAGLAPWAAPYITNYLGKAQALGEAPYQTYQGPLTAGPSALQTQAFQGIGNLTVPPSTYTPVGGSFTDTGVAQSYMNPYLQQTLNPQLQAMQRQADIQRNVLGAQAAKSGAFGGARSGLQESQLNAELMRQQQQATGQAYANAFDKAQQQYNAEQQRKIQEAQFGAGYGLQNLAAQQNVLNQMAGLGQTQRDIAQQGITADLEEFNRQRDFPYKQVQYMRDMISGLPISSVTNQPSQLSGIASLIAAMGGVDKLLGATGQPDLGSLFENLFGISLGGNKAP